MADTIIRQLMGTTCVQCAAVAFPPAGVCPVCRSREFADTALPTAGTLYAFSIVRIGPKGRPTPYGVGYVDIPGAVRLFVHLDPTADWHIDDTVDIALADDDAIPVARRQEQTHA
jgi:uncharacterized OB-fold protein